MGAVEELDALELEDVFKTNFFGAREVIRALLPTLRASPYLHALRADSDEVSARWAATSENMWQRRMAATSC